MLLTNFTMKRYFIFLGLLLFFLNSFSQRDYSGYSQIHLRIKNIGTQVVKISDLFQNLDSCVLKNDTGSLKVYLSRPNVYQLSFEKGGTLLVFIDTSEISVTGTYATNALSKYVCKGTVNTTAYSEFLVKIHEFSVTKYNLAEEDAKKNKVKIDSVQECINSLVLKSILQSRSNYLNEFYLAIARLQQDNNKLLGKCLDELLKRYSGYELFLKDYPVFDGVIRERYLSKLDLIDTSIILQSTTGSAITLNTIEKKYLILDFMADWCVPCIQSIPLLKQVAAENSQNTAVLSIALNSKKEKIDKLIKSHSINWPTAFVAGKENTDKIYHDFKINLFPTYILCYSSGEVLMRKTGEPGLVEIANYIKKNK